MFCKASLVTLTLALLASASPFVHETTGVRIPLEKRGSLVNVDGTFNHEKVVLHGIKTHK